MNIVVGFLMLAGVGALLAYIAKRKRHWRMSVEHVAAIHQLDVNEGNFITSAEAVGEVDGLKTTIDTYTVQTGKHSTTYSRVLVDLGLHAEININEEGIGTVFTKFFSGDDIEINIEAFDNFAYLQGPESILLASLEHQARAALREGIAAGVSIQNGHARVRQQGLVQDPERLVEMTESALTLARALTRNTGSIREGLARNALHDPDLNFRMRCFDQLTDKYSVSQETRKTAQVLLKSEIPSAQVKAAIYLGFEGLDVLESLALDGSNRDDHDGKVPLAVRAEALRGFADILGTSQRIDALLVQIATNVASPQSGQASKSLGTLGALILSLAAERKVGIPFDSLPFNRFSYTVSDGQAFSSQQRVLLAGALEFCDDERVEARLLELLADEDDSVAAAAARALGTVGKVNVVPELIERSNGFFESPDLKHSARTAIGLIQGRVGRHLGQSVSFAEEGQSDGLSMPESES